MPKPIPYFTCKNIPPSFLSFENKNDCFEWYETPSEELNIATEIGGIFIKDFGKDKENVVTEIQDIPKLVHKAASIWGKPALKLSIASLQELDKYSSGYTNLDFLMSDIITKITRLLDNYTIAINFREVFLVPAEGKPPSHYRPDIDICVDNLKDYQEQTSKLSYQIVKTLFNRLGSGATPITKKGNPSPILNYLTKNGSSIWQQHIFPDPSSALKELPWYNSPFEALSTGYLNAAFNKTGCFIFPFAQPISLADLSLYQFKFDGFNKSELIIVLRGKQYQEANERQRVYQDALKLINQPKFCGLLHVILLTKETDTENLLNLAPDAQKKEGAFSTLADDAGYYLSSSDVFTKVFRKIQKPCPSSDWFDEFQKTNVAHVAMPSMEKTSPYIYGQEAGPNFRKSKRFNKQALKAQVSLALTQQQQETQTQTLSQQQAISQVTQQKQEQSMQASFAWDPIVTFDHFCNNLKSFAQKELQEQGKTSRLVDQIYLTQYYREHHGKERFLRKIESDEEFRNTVAAKIFGMAYTRVSGTLESVFLHNYSAELLDERLSKELLGYIDCLQDGFNPDHRKITVAPFFGARVLMNASNKTKRRYEFQPPMTLSSLALLGTKEQSTYQSHLHYAVLLRDEDLEGLSVEQKTLLICQAEALLDLFKKPTSPLVNLAERKAGFVALIKLYFPDHPAYLSILDRFFAVFEQHNADNLRILIQILISGRREKMESFFKLLLLLESRSLLKNFYIIYFKYATHIFSVVTLLDNIGPLLSTEYTPDEKKLIHSEDPLISLAFDRDKGTPVHNKPLFEKFCLHLLVFAAQNGQEMNEHRLEEIKKYWHKLWIKFYAYADQQDQVAAALIESLVTNLTQGEGLALAPLCAAETFYDGLEHLIDNAIANKTLKEQLEELRGVSLVWIDTPYAITQNSFKIVCAEMDLQAQAINPVTQGYSVTLDELKRALKNHQHGSSYLKKAIFRYFGKEKSRESIAFYRELFTLVKTSEHDAQGSYIKELLLGYYVSTATGSNYNPYPNQQQFSADFIAFLKNIKTTESVQEQLVLSILQEFFDHLSLSKTNAQKGIKSLWTLWQEKKIPVFTDSKTVIPEILTQQFEQTQIKRFLFKNSDALNQCAPLLNKDPELAYALLTSWFSQSTTAQFEKMSLLILRKLYPELTMELLIKDLGKISALIDAFTLLVKRGGRGKIYVALNKIIEQKPSVDQVLYLINTVSHEIAQDQNNSNRDSVSANFLIELAVHPHFLNNIITEKPVLALIFNYYFHVKIKKVELPLLFVLCRTLMGLGIDRATQSIKILLSSLQNSEAYTFFRENRHLTAEQIDGITLIIEQVSDLSHTLPFLKICLQENPENDFMLILNELKSLGQEHKKHLVFLCPFICSAPDQPIFAQLEQLKKIPPTTLKQLVHVTNLYTIERNELVALLASPSITEGIAQFERDKHALNKERYHFSPDKVAEKIARIKHKLPSGKETTLNTNKQEKLLNDYKRLMSYMTNNPILIEKDNKGIIKEFTINELSEAQFPILLKRLNEQISKEQNKHEHQLMLLALCCEALYRTTGKFPRDTQILNLLTNLNYDFNLIHEVQTGEGKSIIAAFNGVMLYDGKRSIDIATENNHLADGGLNKFRPFFNYFGIPCCSSIIEAHSAHNEYLEGGVNYSTASNLALFRARMKLNKKHLSKNVALVCDEVDANLTTLIQFRLSATLDPMLLDINSWSAVYKCLLDFVKEKEIFIENQCDSQEDSVNFRSYFLLRHPRQELTDFVKRLSDELLGSLIESAEVAHGLEENVDYFVLPKIGNTKSLYAAPILESTKRPDPRVSYCASVQQLLHTQLNNRQPPPKFPFDIEPCSETFITVNAKNFFDFYRLNGGPIVGLTGTAGIDVEFQEFYQHHGLHALNYPTFHENLCEDLGFFAAFGPDEHEQLILKKIQEHKRNRPGQPILIITSSPQETIRINNFLAAKTAWDLQCYSGYENEGISEAEIIRRAGMDNRVTIANESLARGADIDPAHPLGLFVINACTDVTVSGLRQIKGRAARNGKHGSFCSIIDATKIASPTNTLDEIAALFLNHQHDLSLLQQKQRLKTRLLEESRYYIVTDHLLELREIADKILNKYFGPDSDLVSTKELMKTLSALNQRAERHYNELLENYSIVEGDVADEFLAARVVDYQMILDHWLPDERFKEFKPIEPSIPLENLQELSALHSVSVDQLTVLSELLSKGWVQVGHRNMLHLFTNLDKLIHLLHPYFRKESSLKHLLIESLQNQGMLDVPKIVETLAVIEKVGIELIELAQGIPLVGSYVPKKPIIDFITSYSTTTKTQIKDKKWDELALPKIDFTAISTWYARISTLMSIASFGTSGSPISFIINRFVVPAIIEWVGGYFQKEFENQESSYLPVLKELSSISSDLTNAVSALASLPSSQNINLGFMLDKFAPLLKNEALLNIAIKYFELNEQPHLIPYIQAVPEILKTLEPYRETKMSELFQMKTLTFLFSQLSQLSGVKKIVEQTEFKDIFSRISDLTPDFLSAVSQLSFEEFVGLAKVIAHPNYFDFLKKLPAQTSFAKLILWLNENPEGVPIDIKAALDELWAYQNNRERINEENIQTLRTLKDSFNLTLDKLKTGLASIAPVPSDIVEPEKPDLSREVIAPKPTPTAKTTWLIYGAFTLCLTLIVICNVVFFSPAVLLTSLTLIGLLASPIIKDHIIPMFRSKPENNAPVDKAENNTPIIEPPIRPILVDTLSDLSESVKTNLPVSLDGFKRKQTTLSVNGNAYKGLGFFGKAKNDEQIAFPSVLEATFANN